MMLAVRHVTMSHTGDTPPPGCLALAYVAYAREPGSGAMRALRDMRVDVYCLIFMLRAARAAPQALDYFCC